MDKGTVFYLSASCGISNPDGKQPITYYGKVYRIPRSEHGTIRQLEWELTPDDLLADLINAHGKALRRAPEGVIERFEMLDGESGDLWVMYRVPCYA
jgi:hypothetical protein